MQYHYSKRVPQNVRLVCTAHLPGGLFGTCGECVAACFFCTPATRWSEEVWELSRLVRKDGLKVQISALVSAAVRRCKSEGFDLLVSFADWTQRHHGGVYQACGWNYAGKRERRMDGVMVDGEFVPGRTCNHRYGTRSLSVLRELFSQRRVEPHYDDGKHLYWKATTPSGKDKAMRLGLKSLPYPKPKNMEVEL
jgi:hypothetical protein